MCTTTLQMKLQRYALVSTGDILPCCGGPICIHTTYMLQAYKDLRLRGENELGSILLGLSTSLLTFDFHDTFVNAFEVGGLRQSRKVMSKRKLELCGSWLLWLPQVSNKVAELLMLEEEREVCCRSETDRELYDRIEQEDTKQ